MLELKNVSKAYGKTRILSGASFSIRPKDCACITGKGGSGKSTLLKLLVRAEDPTSGTVLVDGVNLKHVPPPVLQLYRRRLGVAYQEPMILAHATVAENIALPLELFGAPESMMKKTTNDLMERFGLTSKAQHLAGTLSMSERSLTSIARAIIAAPMILLADEPLLHLDAAQTTIVTELLKNMHDHGTTLLLFSRTAETARLFGARTVHLANGALTAEPELEMEIPGMTALPKEDGTHRILEENAKRTHPAPVAADPDAAAKKPAPKSGKSVRITSIGSGL